MQYLYFLTNNYQCDTYFGITCISHQSLPGADDSTYFSTREFKPMKTPLFALIAVMLLTACSTLSNPPAGTNDGMGSTLSEVVNVDGTTKDQLYAKARQWFATAFKSSKDAIQLEDARNGKIIAQGAIWYEAPAFDPGTAYSDYFRFTLTVEVKDNRIRYAFEDIRLGTASFDAAAPYGIFVLPESWYKMQQTGYAQIRGLTASLKTALTAKSADW